MVGIENNTVLLTPLEETGKKKKGINPVCLKMAEVLAI
jgi:hypothetical protein